jgi:hypothetical protein
MKIAHEIESETVLVNSIMSTTRPAGPRSGATFKREAELANQKMVADVAPTVYIHVVVLRGANLGLGRIHVRRVEVARVGGVMDDHTVQRGHGRDRTLWCSGSPLAARGYSAVCQCRATPSPALGLRIDR